MADSSTPGTSPVAKLPAASTAIWNVPNQLTVARLVLSIICFVFLAFDSYLIALILFVIAAGTDWVDGYWARKYGQVTQLGRILDPFADKIIICGTFIFLAAVPPDVMGNSASEVAAWMAVVVMGREILVTALRSFFEEHGTDFSAKWAGKVKMVLQCAAVAASLGRLWWYDYAPTTGGWGRGRLPSPDWTEWVVKLLVWTAVISTIYSGWGYVQTALRMLRKSS
jgi:CDP-diacylglycerol---glycerol-3-phosphate 3-phosphatidyltransferase